MATAVFQLRADDELLREVKKMAGKRRVSVEYMLPAGREVIFGSDH